MKNVIIDFDNTIGIEHCDIDDALALIYLLGDPGVTVRAVTTSFGNSTQENVTKATRYLFDELGLSGIPVYRGCDSPTDRKSAAADFIAGYLAGAKGKCTLLVTGSVSNIYQAWLQNGSMADALDEIVFMGGVTERLLLHGHDLPELNFSVDPEAAHGVMAIGAPKTVITANPCLSAFFDDEIFSRLRGSGAGPHMDFLLRHAAEWADFLEKVFSVRGFHVWDVVAACYLTDPALFAHRWCGLFSSPDDFRTGLLRCGEKGGDVNIPTAINDLALFWDTVVGRWVSALR